MSVGVVRLGLGDHHDAFLASPTFDAERDDVAGPDAVDIGDGPLDVFGEDVATADDDQVLDAPAEHELAVEQVGEVAGAQPLAVERGGRGRRVLVVAGRDRGAPDLELADLTIAAAGPVAGSTTRISSPGTGRPSRARRRVLSGPTGAGAA